MVFNILLLISVFSISADINTLRTKKEALQLEYNLVKNSPTSYYLIIDFAAKEAHLKADANLLRTCKIMDSFGNIPPRTQKLTLHNHIQPYTTEPKTVYRQRELPLDFSERLTNGPKSRSRLYFMPSFLIQSAGLPTPRDMPGIQLSKQDTKALASALPPNTITIVIPSTSKNLGLAQ
ncbi:MAG: hypothetical protein HOE48_25745 [Candidatus Latescibacteria bacterium]|nr:hypothetical protein [Candidatus Latescibacterota bacterium]